MIKLESLQDEKKRIKAEIKAEKQRLRKEKGSWLTRFEYSIYLKLKAKFENSPIDNSVEQKIDETLDRLEGILDQAMTEEQPCSQQA